MSTTSTAVRSSVRLLAATSPDLAGHHATWGPLPTSPAEELLAELDVAGLLGKGGAGFPVARKVRAVAAGGKTAVVVGNGAEGEPASAKDRMLLLRAPHLVLDGLQLAARIVGADQAYLVTHADNALSDRVVIAMSERRDRTPVQVRHCPAP